MNVLQYLPENQGSLLTLITNLTRWHYLCQFIIQSPDGATCINYKIGHQVASISFCFKFGHQVAPLALPHRLGLPYQQQELSWYPQQPESHQLSFNNPSQWVSNRHQIQRSDPRYTWYNWQTYTWYTWVIFCEIKLIEWMKTMKKMIRRTLHISDVAEIQKSSKPD